MITPATCCTCPHELDLFQQVIQGILPQERTSSTSMDDAYCTLYVVRLAQAVKADMALSLRLSYPVASQ